MEYQYIEKGTKQLYSVYHEPRGLAQDDVGIVLCYPIGQELIRCHKLYVNLARQLADMGFHVLRFDFSGMGDSYGDFASFSLEEGIDDIGMAVNELREGCGVTEVILIGVRLGATLALRYSKRNKVDGLVLWHPVTDGQKYLQEIRSDYNKWLFGSFSKEKKDRSNGMSCFGFHFSAALINDIKSVRLNEEDFITGEPMLLIDDARLFNITDRRNFSFEVCVNKEYWLKRENEMNKGVIPNHELGKTVEWINNKLIHERRNMAMGL